MYELLFFIFNNRNFQLLFSFLLFLIFSVLILDFSSPIMGLTEQGAVGGGNGISDGRGDEEIFLEEDIIPEEVILERLQDAPQESLVGTSYFGRPLRFENILDQIILRICEGTKSQFKSMRTDISWTIKNFAEEEIKIHNNFHDWNFPEGESPKPFPREKLNYKEINNIRVKIIKNIESWTDTLMTYNLPIVKKALREEINTNNWEDLSVSNESITPSLIRPVISIIANIYPGLIKNCKDLIFETLSSNRKEWRNFKNMVTLSKIDSFFSLRKPGKVSPNDNIVLKSRIILLDAISKGKTFSFSFTKKKYLK